MDIVIYNSKGNLAMQTENKEDIIDFNDLFEEKKPPKVKHEVASKIKKGNALTFIGIYFFMTIVVALFIQIALIVTKTGTSDISEHEAMVETISSSTYGLGYLESDMFEQFKSTYKNVVIITESNGYVFLANENNPDLGGPYTIQDIKNFYQSDAPVWADKVILQPKVNLQLLNDGGAFVNKFGIILNDNVAYNVPSEHVIFSTDATTLINFGIYLLLAIALIPLAFKTLKLEFGLYFPRQSWLKDVLIGYGLMFIGSAVAVVFVQVIGIIFNYLPSEAVNQQAIQASLFSKYGFLMIIVTVVFAPLFEELIFRKAFFSLFKKEYVALVFTSLLFGLIHVVGEASLLGFITNWITYSTSGFVLGYIYIKNNHNIWSSILIHAVYNAVAIVLMFFVM